MKITFTSNTLRYNFNALLNCAIPEISCASVFEYYTQYSMFSFVNGMKPCLLSDTVFSDVKCFDFF